MPTTRHADKSETVTTVPDLVSGDIRYHRLKRWRAGEAFLRDTGQVNFFLIVFVSQAPDISMRQDYQRKKTMKTMCKMAAMSAVVFSTFAIVGTVGSGAAMAAVLDGAPNNSYCLSNTRVGFLVRLFDILAMRGKRVRYGWRLHR